MDGLLQIFLPIIIAFGCALAVIVIVIRKMVVADTERAIRKVRQVEEEVRKKEESIRQDIERHEKEFEQLKAAADEELRNQKVEGEKMLAKSRDQVIADARKEAEGIVDEARRNEKRFREQLVQEMREKTVRSAGEVFELVFSNNIADDINASFVNELLDALDEVEEGSMTVTASDSAFTARYPLRPEQRERLETLIRKKFGVDIEVTEKIDESIMAGLILKLGSLEIDGSLRNRFAEAVEEVSKLNR